MEHGSSPIGHSLDQNALDSLQFNAQIQHLMTAPPENANSFTALLDLPAPQAVQLLHHHHSPESTDYSAAKPNVKADGRHHHYTPYHSNPWASLTFPSNTTLIERAAKFSVFASDRDNNYSPDTMGLVPSNSSGYLGKVKNEPAESVPNLSQPLDMKTEDQNQNKRSAKRKEREKKGKAETKKRKNGDNEGSEDAEKLPYVHVRARRGQATDSHSLAERARREKINARMKLLQELVPGCDKISGTTLVLDEIINHVQSLQSQVEFLSMRLAAVNPRIDFNLNSILAAEGGSLMDCNFTGLIMPVMWPEVQASGNRQQYQKQWRHFDGHNQQPICRRKEESNNFLISENSLLSSDSSAISATLHPNQLKMGQ